MNYYTATLPSGLRVIHQPSASPVVFCGYVVGGGTRHEQAGEEGLAHFCEHLSFKGTSRRTAVQILNAIEGVGGELNAYTGKEDTVYYAAITRDHVRKAVDVLSDLVFCSEYPQHELEKECEVVCDEIESYEDSPSELIFDDFENLLFKSHPLGHNILGTAERVRSYRSDDARRFTARYYRPENAVFFASGDLDFRQLLKWLGAMAPVAVTTPVASASGAIASIAPIAPIAPTSPPEPVILHRNTHQAHVMVGTLAYAATDPRRWALYLLNNLLGGPSMNSRLNLALRERNALVYTVESQMTCYSDTGAWSVYFGCDPADVKRCLRLVRRELDRLMQTQLTTTQLARAKQQLHGQIAIAAENREQAAIEFGRYFLHEGRERHLSELLAHIDALTAHDLQLTAQELFSEDRIQVLVYN